MARICVVDDQAVMRESVAATLERAHHLVRAFGDPVVALEAMRTEQFDLVLTDLKMPKMDGLSLIRAIREIRGDAVILVMTAYGTVHSAVEAMKLGAFEFIQKPFEADGLEIQVERALQHRSLRDENEALRTSLNDLREDRSMIGESEAMTEVRRKIEQYGGSDATVLISGESGTGKELAASAIHRASARRDRPLLCVNCAALSASLLESELFGHERGSFTGADRQRHGRFELAHGGTLLLDEISEMPAPLQGKLLRVLQEGEFERVGSSVTRRVDVRVIATTNRVLEEWVARKRFRADLYYRLNVLPLHLAPLRDRPEDIPLLVTQFLTQIARHHGRAAMEVEPGAMSALLTFGWPGNIRELENVCQRAAATIASGVIRRADVEQWLGGGGAAEETFSQLRPGRMLEDMERQLVERTLKRFKGHRANTARALGMGLRTLGLKLRQWREHDEAATQRKFETVGAEPARGYCASGAVGGAGIAFAETVGVG